VFEFTFNVTYFNRVIDIQCMRSYLVYQTLNILIRVVVIGERGVERGARPGVESDQSPKGEGRKELRSFPKVWRHW
jgi:hypothetical protein